jgi:hypothetical protein
MMAVEEAREVLARYLSGSDLARRWDIRGITDEEWPLIKADLEDVLMGEFTVYFEPRGRGGSIRGYRLFWSGGVIGAGTVSELSDHLYVVAR